METWKSLTPAEEWLASSTDPGTMGAYRCVIDEAQRVSGACLKVLRDNVYSV
jgi:hypothetical protein